MSEIQVIEQSVLQPIKIKLAEGEEYTLLLNYKAIARAEELLGNKFNLLSAKTWFELTPGQFYKVVYSAFAKYHPDVTLDQVQDMLNPSQQGRLKDAMFELLFPGVLDKILKYMTEEKEDTGEPQPTQTDSQDSSDSANQAPGQSTQPSPSSTSV